MNLSDAISAVEASQGALQNAVTQTANDQAAAAAIQAKLDAASAQVASDSQVQASAASTFNDSLDALIAAAQAAKIS